MTTQPEALRLANYIEKCDRCGGTKAAAAEPRRLQAENQAKDALMRARTERVEGENEALLDSCKAKSDRIDRLGEAVERLQAERNALLEALWVVATGNTDPDEMVRIARAAVAKVEGK